MGKSSEAGGGGTGGLAPIPFTPLQALVLPWGGVLSAWKKSFGAGVNALHGPAPRWRQDLDFS